MRAKGHWARPGAGGIVMVALACAVSSVVPAPMAQARGVADGVAWLVGHQDGSGLWGVPGPTSFRDATATVRALSTLGADSAGVFTGLAAINATATTSSDYLARRMLANAASASGIGVEGMAADLIGRRSTDGGWGYGARYGSNVLETALAVEALDNAAHADTALLGISVRYLVAHQNLDYAWAFTVGDTSRVYYTAHVLLALEAVQDSFDVTAAIQSGVDWLKTQNHDDGGFGTGGHSNAYETALALLAMAPVDSLAPEFRLGLNYLRTTQQPDGSWQGDAYSTALAVLTIRSTATVAVEPAAEPPTLRFGVTPNPARNVAMVALTLPQPAHVRLAIYDVTGRLIRLLLSGEIAAGSRSLPWDLVSDEGTRVSSGAYYLRMTCGTTTLTRKLVLTR